LPIAAGPLLERRILRSSDQHVTKFAVASITPQRIGKVWERLRSAMFAQQQMTEIGLSRCEVRLDGKRLLEALLRFGGLVLLRPCDAQQRPAIRAARVLLQKALQSIAGFPGPPML
jgi:hypothetical protein